MNGAVQLNCVLNRFFCLLDLSVSDTGMLESPAITVVVYGEGNGNPLQYSCLEKSMDRGARQAAVHGVT